MSLDGINATTGSASVNWTAAKDRPGYNPITNPQQLTEQVSFNLGTLADEINEILSFIVDIPPATLLEVDLTDALDNVVNDKAVPLNRVKLLLIKLLSEADLDQDGQPLGTTCQQITFGNDPAAPTAGAWHGPFADPSGRIILESRDFILCTRRSAKGMAVGDTGSGTLLLLENNDPAVPAAVRVTIYGCG